MKKTITMLMLLCAAGFAQEKGSFKDARDGKTYKTVKIGTQTWMAENLNYDAKGSVCYDNKPANCTKYGKLYRWGEAMKACPSGWHLPSWDEWQTLVDFAGGNEAAVKKLKAKSGWNSDNGKSGNGTDDFGFAALPGGANYIGSIGNVFEDIGNHGSLWSAWKQGAYYRFDLVDGYHGDANTMGEDASSLLGVRCVQGSVEEAKAELKKKAEAEKAKLFNPKIKYGSMTDARDKTTYKTVKIGTQTWMAENLNYNAKGSECYSYSESNCTKYGKLYYWKTAMKACPSGWHLPSDAEWDALMTAVGGEETAGTKLKSTIGWKDGGNGTDDYGFSALPGGGGDSSGHFINIGEHGNWWSATEYTEYYGSGAYYRYIYDGALVDSIKGANNYLFSVRCVQD